MHKSRSVAEVHRRCLVVVVSSIVVLSRHRVHRCRRKRVRASSTLIVSTVVGHRCWPVFVVVGIVVVRALVFIVVSSVVVVVGIVSSLVVVVSSVVVLRRRSSLLRLVCGLFCSSLLRRPFVVRQLKMLEQSEHMPRMRL